MRYSKDLEYFGVSTVAQRVKDLLREVAGTIPGLSELKCGVATSDGISHVCSSDPALLWLL